ncbi:hypothetical protein Q7C36_012122 [Tachysurus vachellii]|uniref:Uncharacterized protein n=1 Tax=Tachysurus vachellii TaxID=175792 RepID=A0AA88SRH2_TACVA|nr:hypothetical protein Q7C36_012122 [Tachysurus vachellii]
MVWDPSRHPPTLPDVFPDAKSGSSKNASVKYEHDDEREVESTEGGVDGVHWILADGACVITVLQLYLARHQNKIIPCGQYDKERSETETF